MKIIIYFLFVVFVLTSGSSASAQALTDLVEITPIQQNADGTWDSRVQVKPEKNGSNYYHQGNYNNWLEEPMTDSDNDGRPDFVVTGWNRIIEFSYKQSSKKYNSLLGATPIKAAIIDGGKAPVADFQPQVPEGCFGDRFYRCKSVGDQFYIYTSISAFAMRPTSCSLKLSCSYNGMQEWGPIALTKANSWGWSEPIIVPFAQIYYRDNAGKVYPGLLKFYCEGIMADGSIASPRNIQECILMQDGIATHQVWDK